MQQMARIMLPAAGGARLAREMVRRLAQRLRVGVRGAAEKLTAAFQRLSRRSKIGLGLAAAAAVSLAALFGPLRRRIQAFIDRRFYRRKYNAERVLATFSSRLRDETDLDRLSEELLVVVRETVQPSHASLWLRGTRERT